MDRKRYRGMRGSASTSAGDSTGFFPEEERAHEHLFQLGNDLKSMLSEIFSDQAAQREMVTKLKKINRKLLKSNQELKEKVMKLEKDPEFGHNKTAAANELDAFRCEPKRKYEVLEALRLQLKKKDVELDALKKELNRKNEVLPIDGNADDDDVQEWMKNRNADHYHDDEGVQEWMKDRNADHDDDDDEVMEEDESAAAKMIGVQRKKSKKTIELDSSGMEIGESSRARAHVSGKTVQEGMNQGGGGIIFTMTMSQSHSEEDRMYLPGSFVYGFNWRAKTGVILFTEEGSFRLELKNYGMKRVVFRHGWRDFYHKNNISLGTLCTFRPKELSVNGEASVFSMNVSITGC